MSRIVVIGGGAWGQALASLWRDDGHDAQIWSRRAPLHATAFQAAEVLVAAVPAQAMGTVLADLELPTGIPLVITAKGIERSTHRLMHEVAAATVPANPALVLSGPSFAGDVLKGLPTAVTLAAPTQGMADAWARDLSRPAFRIYGTDDVLGVALGGSLKNVLAIACGIADGRKLGESARAALIARGFSELTRLGRAMGARTETLMGLSGLGDLLLTCASAQSRNYGFGFRVGAGQTPAQALSAASGVVEGVFSAQAAQALAAAHGVDLPITTAVQAIVEGGSDPDTEIARLLARPVAREFS